MSQTRERFAQLRSLMNRAQLGKADQRELWGLVQECATLDPDAYRSHWLTYMQGFPHHWVMDAMTLTSIEELEHAASLLPFGRFSLNLQSKGITTTKIARIARSSALAQVDRLHLTHNAIGDEGVEKLVASPHLHTLQEIYLGRNQIGDEGARAIAQSTACTHLTTLDLQINQIGDAGAMALAEASSLSALKTLYLSSNRIALEGARALARSSCLGGERLQDRVALYIDQNTFGDLGVEALISSRAVNLRGALRHHFAMKDAW